MQRGGGMGTNEVQGAEPQHHNEIDQLNACLTMHFEKLLVHILLLRYPMILQFQEKISFLVSFFMLITTFYTDLVKNLHDFFRIYILLFFAGLV
mgnify:CR=1 FL=1